MADNSAPKMQAPLAEPEEDNRPLEEQLADISAQARKSDPPLDDPDTHQSDPNPSGESSLQMATRLQEEAKTLPEDQRVEFEGPDGKKITVPRDKVPALLKKGWMADSRLQEAGSLRKKANAVLQSMAKFMANQDIEGMREAYTLAGYSKQRVDQMVQFAIDNKKKLETLAAKPASEPGDDEAAPPKRGRAEAQEDEETPEIVDEGARQGLEDLRRQQRQVKAQMIQSTESEMLKSSPVFRGLLKAAKAPTATNADRSKLQAFVQDVRRGILTELERSGDEMPVTAIPKLVREHLTAVEERVGLWMNGAAPNLGRSGSGANANARAPQKKEVKDPSTARGATDGDWKGYYEALVSNASADDEGDSEMTFEG